MARSIKWLFVYGTLLSRSRDQIGREMRRHLQTHCIKRRPARVAGLLYDLGGYPGWVEQPGGNHWVYGEALLLDDCGQVFQLLDPYENFDPKRPDEGEYVRVVRQVLSRRGERIGAWAYGYCGELVGKSSIRNGRWLSAWR